MILVAVASTFSLFACLNGYINPALMGVALLFSTKIVQQIKNLTVNYAQMERDFVAVERLYQVIDNTEQEPDYPTVIPSKSWPQYGFIKIDKLVCRYAPHLDDVLKGISLDIVAGHKVGICGRTGSGKSSLTQALLRLLITRGGSITIDGININEMSLKNLRNAVTMVPQDPILFAGSVRNNLDPLGWKSDGALWDALDMCQMKDTVSDLPKGLETLVNNEGDNFSKGQRQLLCFARAFLRDTKIFILDEATAALDEEADERIQKVIRSRFKHCTVLTVAHRVNTIVDSDMILGMEAGRIVEYDTPSNLMNIENSLFRSLVHSSYNL